MDPEPLDLEPDGHAQVRTALMAALETRAVEEKHFRKLLTLATPVIGLGTMAGMLLLAIQFTSWFGVFAPDSPGLVVLFGLDGLYAVMTASVFLSYARPQSPPLPARWPQRALLLLGGLLGISFPVPLPHHVPWLFWPVHLLLGAALLGALAALYQPTDQLVRRADEEDAPVNAVLPGQVLLGCVTAPISFLLGSWASSLRDEWFLHQPPMDHLDLASVIARRLGALDRDGAVDRLAVEPKARRDGALKCLLAAGWVEEKDNLILTARGRTTIGVKWGKEKL